MSFLFALIFYFSRKVIKSCIYSTISKSQHLYLTVDFVSDSKSQCFMILFNFLFKNLFLQIQGIGYRNTYVPVYFFKEM